MLKDAPITFVRYGFEILLVVSPYLISQLQAVGPFSIPFSLGEIQTDQNHPARFCGLCIVSISFFLLRNKVLRDDLSLYFSISFSLKM